MIERRMRQGRRNKRISIINDKDCSSELYALIVFPSSNFLKNDKYIYYCTTLLHTQYIYMHTCTYLLIVLECSLVVVSLTHHFTESYCLTTFPGNFSTKLLSSVFQDVIFRGVIMFAQFPTNVCWLLRAGGEALVARTIREFFFCLLLALLCVAFPLFLLIF